MVVPAATRLQHNPDEPAHFNYVRHLSSGHIPVFHATYYEFEGYQPPLYYTVCLVPYELFKHAGAAACERAVRCVSVLCGLLTIIVAYLIVRSLFPGNPWLCLSTSAFIAVLPQFDNFSAAVSNDPPTVLIVCTALLVLIRLSLMSGDELKSRGVRYFVILGVLAGLGMLTKISVTVFFLSVVVCLVRLARMHLLRPRQILICASACLLPAVLIPLPWLIRNQILYRNFMATQVIESFKRTNVTAAAMVYWKFKTPEAYLLGVSHWTFASWWGVFDAEHLFWGNSYLQPQQEVLSPLPHIYGWLFAVVVISFFGLLRLERRGMLTTERLAIPFSVMAVLFLANLASFLMFNLTFFQPQARYLYPSIVPVTLLFWLGWQGWTRNEAVLWSITSTTIAGLIALNIYTLFFQMIPRFASGA
jgi:hypothetical protein